MSDLYAAGGVGAVLRELKPLLHLDVHDGDRRDAGRAPRARERAWVDRAVVRPLARSATRRTAGWSRCSARSRPTARSSSAPPPTRRLFEREGRAVVFTSLDDLAARIDAPDLDVTPDDFLVLQNAGPKRGYAMPEAGYLPIPQQARARRRQGHGAHFRCAHERHRLRHHRAARLARGRGRRAARAGAQRRPHRAFGGAAARSTSWSTTPSSPSAARRTARPRMKACAAMPGSTCRHVLQAEAGCDFDFLRKG